MYVLKYFGSPQSISVIHRKIEMRMSDRTTKAVLEDLVRQGFAMETPGPRNSRAFSLTAAGFEWFDG